MSQLKHWMEGELPRAQTDLARMARALEDYVALESAAETSIPEELAALIGSGPAAALPEETTEGSIEQDGQETAEPDPVQDDEEKADG